VKPGAVKQVVLFSDGACLGNPGPGGYGVILAYGEHRRELSGGFRRTTNNRMELTAAVKGLEALKERCAVRLVSDSEYLLNAIAKRWVFGWRSRGWRRAAGKIVPNADLWDQILKLIEFHEVSLEWVEGHSGHPENERCDRLAREAASGTDLPPDIGYETSRVTPE
jgi:Ribonuclease HI